MKRNWIGCVAVVLLPLTASAGESITYYHNDLIGSPIAATDRSGFVRWRANYRPYGDRDQTISEELAASDNARWFTSYVHDEESGLTYAGARYYSATMGRFLSLDPVAFNENNDQSFGRYSYANDNPYKFVDPSGGEVVLADLRDKAYLEGLINSRALGVFVFDSSGKLTVVTTKGDSSRYSTYYQGRLMEAIADSNIIKIDKAPSYTSSSGRKVDLDAEAGGGLTESLGHDSFVVVSGSSYAHLRDVSGAPLRDDAADILAHELVGHAIPRAVGPDTGNAVRDENKVRSQVRGGGQRAADPLHLE